LEINPYPARVLTIFCHHLCLALQKTSNLQNPKVVASLININPIMAAIWH